MGEKEKLPESEQIAEFAVVIALVVLGYVQTKTKLNLLTVVAAVGCLPASKMLVEFITIAPHQSIEKRYLSGKSRRKASHFSKKSL